MPKAQPEPTDDLDMQGKSAGNTAEHQRLTEDANRVQNWKRWGPYLSERQWGTVREDYSPTGECWTYFTHNDAIARAYRWGEDGLLGFTDRECRLCFAVALWNGKDPILKERLFGLTGPQGNHGEDVKECYFYLDSTPTHSYVASLYKYPQAPFPYQLLIDENARRSKRDPEFELADSGVFDGSRYFDIQMEYAKAGPDDILVKLTVSNRGPDLAELHVLPTLWFRNIWSWGCRHEGHGPRPKLQQISPTQVKVDHDSLGSFVWNLDPGNRSRSNQGPSPQLLFTENDTNEQRLFNAPNPGPYVKDAFHRRVIDNETDSVNPAQTGTKAAAWHVLALAPGESRTLRFRLSSTGAATSTPFDESFESCFALRKSECDQFYHSISPKGLGVEEARVWRQAYAGLLHSKQFYHYVIKDWIDGDPGQPTPPQERKQGRNADWRHIFNRDVIAMPDKWEYPWYAAWDLAFHVVAMGKVDPEFAKSQILLFLREWYMHPNGQLPAYEFALGDVNPPVHAWAAWRLYKIAGKRGERDREFLTRVFQKLLLNFTWWVNRKDVSGRNIFAGGFLGLDNIGVFDRSKPLPTGGHLEQADGTAWMAFYCGTMLSMALKLAERDPAYEDMASKFFEHYVAISSAMNTLGGTGLWDEEDGFYYDQIHVNGETIPLKIRSMVGLLPLIACEVLDESVLAQLGGFSKRMNWFLKYEQELAQHITHRPASGNKPGMRLLAIPSKERLQRVLRYLFDENEFFSPFGIRSLSKVHERHPFTMEVNGEEFRVDYSPGESTTALFGGNSNWRGPIWFPVNYLIIEALERYSHFYGDDFKVECPTGSGKWLNLKEAACEINRRLARLFVPDSQGRRPCHGNDPRFQSDPHWRDLLLFHEYFHGDSGLGLGASHQTGWTALIARLIEGAPTRMG